MTESSFKNEAGLGYIGENLKRIQADIALAAERDGRAAKDITLLAATKTVPAEKINYAISKGLGAIGENRVQELLEKYDSLNLAGCDCQFIGRLQTNKIKYLIGRVSQIQSIDSLGQVRALARLLGHGGCMNLLIEVNVGKEENKGGVHPDCLYEFIDEAREFSNIHINGLMAVPPATGEIRELRGYFEQMRKYFVDIQAKKMDNVNMNILSMGMSFDFAEAIACGANMVRVGSALFGDRTYH